ncbi:hypothetical protein ACFSUR_00060 [Halalkalibacter alkalisediminis]|uniref:hypothetical protein n=1 Tax=Halalkalibacter alkalisediminis TaxID=935616 RepID=UPI0036338C7F
MDKMRLIAEERYTSGAIQLVDSYESLLGDDDVIVTKILAFSQNEMNRERARQN